MKFKVYFLFALVIGFSACNSSSKTPCDYNIIEVKAKIVDMAKAEDPKTGEMVYTIFMDFDESSLSGEIQNLNELMGYYINDDFFDRNNLKLGNIYKGIVSEKVSGSNCPELYVSFEAGFK